MVCCWGFEVLVLVMGHRGSMNIDLGISVEVSGV